MFLHRTAAVLPYHFGYLLKFPYIGVALIWLALAIYYVYGGLITSTLNFWIYIQSFGGISALLGFLLSCTVAPQFIFFAPMINTSLTFKTIFGLGSVVISHTVYEAVTQGTESVGTVLALSVVTTLIVLITAVLYSWEVEGKDCHYGFTGEYDNIFVPGVWVTGHVILWLGQLWGIWTYIPTEMAQFWALAGLLGFVILVWVVTRYVKSSINPNMCTTHKKIYCDQCSCKDHNKTDCNRCNGNNLPNYKNKQF